MKKFVVGIIMGAVLATAGSVYAEEIKSLVGTAITIEGQYPVKVNGVTAEKQAIVFDGTSYLPVRAIGDAMNMNVSFDADLGIELTPKEEIAVEATTTIAMSEYDAEAIRSSEEQILISEKKIIELTEKIKSQEEELSKEQLKLSQTTDSNQRQWINGQISVIKSSIEGTDQLLQANKDNIPSQQAYIAKIKAKYGL